MTIERYSFPNGILLSENTIIDDQLDQIISKRRDARQILPHGSYDLTPEVWTRHDMHRMYHNIKVEENGEAIYRALPKDPGVGTQEVAGRKIGTPKMGGRIIYMREAKAYDPDTIQGTIVVAGPRHDDPRIRLYELVSHKPGKSPTPTPEQQLRMNETISEPIFSVDEADELIVRNAYEQVRKLPWSTQGKVTLPDLDAFMGYAYLSLRQAGMNLPLNILDRSVPKEKEILSSLPTTHKKLGKDVYWKVLTVPSLTPKLATFLKDFVYVMTPESIAKTNDLDPAETILDFAAKNAAFLRANHRIASYLSQK